jgi:hypothetical protein
MLTKINLFSGREVADIESMGTTIVRPIENCEEAQMPLGSLLLAMILSGSLWYGIIAGALWIYRSVPLH